MHPILEEETVRSPAASIIAQQERFDAFGGELNGERPDEAMATKASAEFYTPPAKPYAGLHERWPVTAL